jgi:hypothetical protein
MQFEVKWIELEIVMLRKISQTQKENYLIFFSTIWYADNRLHKP